MFSVMNTLIFYFAPKALYSYHISIYHSIFPQTRPQVNQGQGMFYLFLHILPVIYHLSARLSINIWVSETYKK